MLSAVALALHRNAPSCEMPIAITQTLASALRLMPPMDCQKRHMKVGWSNDLLLRCGTDIFELAGRIRDDGERRRVSPEQTPETSSSPYVHSRCRAAERSTGESLLRAFHVVALNYLKQEGGADRDRYSVLHRFKQEYEAHDIVMGPTIPTELKFPVAADSLDGASSFLDVKEADDVIMKTEVRTHFQSTYPSSLIVFPKAAPP